MSPVGSWVDVALTVGVAGTAALVVYAVRLAWARRAGKKGGRAA